MRVSKTFFAGLLAMGLATAAPALADGETATGGSIYGVWRNAKDAVHISIRPCGQNACGTVIKANAKAQADARKAGTEQLVGLQVFRNLKQDQDGTWKGRVFAPDIGMTFAGTARVPDGDSLLARGCLIGGLICRSQTWFRIGD
jgi:uncharacterized protein (DUF2147 family)